MRNPKNPHPNDEGETLHVEHKHLRALPPAPDKCQQCATKHKPNEPHNRDSLYYQMWFASHNYGKSPTWADAMAHCEPKLQKLWQQALREKGIDIGEITREK